MAKRTPYKLPEKYARFFEQASPETKLQVAKIGRKMREQYESWEQALRGNTSKLEARAKARIATDDELEVLCDLAARRVNGKQYLKRLNEEIARDVVAGHFLEILRADPSARLTKQMKGDVEERFRVRSSLAAEIWAKVKGELAQESVQV